MKRVVAIVLLCFCLIWCYRIYSINKTPKVINYYSIGDSMNNGDYSVRFLESHLEDLEEFNTRSGADVELDYGISGDCKIISICLEVKNISDKDILWDEIFSHIDFGFESPVWCSVADPNIGSKINAFNNQYLPSGSTQIIWFATTVYKTCFRENSWRRVNEYEYYYVLPAKEKTVVRLEV